MCTTPGSNDVAAVRQWKWTPDSSSHRAAGGTVLGVLVVAGNFCGRQNSRARLEESRRRPLIGCYCGGRERRYRCQRQFDGCVHNDDIVLPSQDVVAASRTVVGAFWMAARAMGARCFCPHSGVVVLSLIRVCSLVGWFGEVRNEAAPAIPGQWTAGWWSGVQRRSPIRWHRFYLHMRIITISVWSCDRKCACPHPETTNRGG